MDLPLPLPLPLKRKQAREVDESLSSSAMEDLPSHILMEIISRLPIKTVMAIRCVSKSLLNLVSDTSFKEMYSTTAPTELLLRSCVKRSKSDRHGYKPFHEYSSSTTTLFIAETVFQDDSSTVVDMKIDVVFELPKFSVRAKNTLNFRATKTKLTLVNSCNGLVCYIGPDTNRFAVIMNPFTGEYVTVPGPDKKDMTLESKDTSYGFGFSPKDHKFKLLRLLWWENVETDPFTRRKRISMIGDIYTFGESGLWKSVANCPNVYPPRNATFFEGLLHWYWAGSIVTFDFDSEQFSKRFTLPRLHHLHTGVFEGCLFTTGRNVIGGVETWVMKEYGGVETWVMKEYGLDSWAEVFTIHKGADYRGINEPIKYLPNGEILMLMGLDEIVRYNPYTRSVTRIGKFFAGCEAILIRPCLVSLEVMLGVRYVLKNHTKVANTEVAKYRHWWTRSRPVPEWQQRMIKISRDKRKKRVEPVTEELQASKASSSKSLEASVSSPIPVQSEVDVIKGVVGQGAGTEVRDSRNQSVLDSEQRDRATLTRTVCEECMQQVEVIKRKMEHLEEEDRQWRDAQRDLQIHHLLALLGQCQKPPFPDDDAPHFDDYK